MSHRLTTNPTSKHSAHHPVVVSKHESCADGISKGADLLLPKHELQEREDALTREKTHRNVEMSRRAKHKKRIVSAVSARSGPTLLAAGGQISLEISGIVVSFEGSDFQKNF